MLLHSQAQLRNCACYGTLFSHWGVGGSGIGRPLPSGFFFFALSPHDFVSETSLNFCCFGFPRNSNRGSSGWVSVMRRHDIEALSALFDSPGIKLSC